MTTKTDIDESASFGNFYFQLGQLVQHKVTGDEGIIVQRHLVQNQHGGTGHAYYVNFGPSIHTVCLEVELEKFEDDEG